MSTMNITKITLSAAIAISYMVMAPITTYSAPSATITKEEWAILMQNPEFKEADKRLTEAYKKAAAAQPDADNAQALLKEQRAWAAKRERDAFAAFTKGTPAYSRFLIDAARERIAVLEQHLPKASTAVQTVKFNGKSIPITIFYHDVPAGEIFGEGINLDSLAFTYDNAKQIVRLKPITIFYQVEEGEPFGLLEVDVDYNFDGHMDIAFVSSRGNTAEWKQIYIYDPKTKSYAYQSVLSEEPNLWTGNDPKKQTLSSHINAGHAGLLYEDKEYKWKNGRLTLTFFEKQDCDGEGCEAYVRTTRRLLGDGSWKEMVRAGLSGDRAVPGN